MNKQDCTKDFVIINQQIIEYIEDHRQAFELDMPKIGDRWKVDAEKKYPNVNGGKPVLELINEDTGEWMRLPKSVVVDGKVNPKRMRLVDIPAWSRLEGEEGMKWAEFWKGGEIPVITQEKTDDGDSDWIIYNKGYKIRLSAIWNLPKS